MKSLFDAAYQKDDYYPILKAYYDQLMYNDRMVDFHQHAAIEIMYVRSGFCEIPFFNETITLHKNQLILIDSMVIHGLKSNLVTNNAMMNIEFVYGSEKRMGPGTGQMFRTYGAYHDFFLRSAPYIIIMDRDGCLQQLLKQVISYAVSNDPDYTALCPMAIQQLMLAITALSESRKVGGRDKSQFHVLEAREYIDKNFKEDIHIDHIAGKLHVNPSYLQRLFKTAMDETIGSYITRLRIQYAQQLLQRTNYSIIDIAVESGFNSQQYFTERFKAMTGQTPYQYRKQHSAQRPHHAEY